MSEFIIFQSCCQTKYIMVSKKFAMGLIFPIFNVKIPKEKLFLLNFGIKPTFYEPEYNQYCEDGLVSKSSAYE